MMKTSVAPISIGVLIMAMLSACGGAPIELAANEAYCIAEGDDPELPEFNSCSNAHGIFIYRENGELQRLALEQPSGFATAATISDGKLIEVGSSTIEEESKNKLRRIGDHIRISENQDGYEATWLIPAKSRMASKVRRFDKAMRKLDPAKKPPTGQAGFVDVPLCYSEQQYRNGREVGDLNSCPETVVFFTSENKVVYVTLDTLGNSSGPEWQIQEEWRLSGNVARLSDQKDLTWTSDAIGAPIAERQIIKQKITGFQQRRDPNVREIEISYPLYSNTDKEEVMRAYATRVYPQLRRQLVIEKYFADN